MSGKVGKSKGKSSTSANLPPELKAAFDRAMGMAEGIANRPFEAYTPDQGQISQFMNPYTQAVTDTTVQELGRQLGIQQAGARASAVAPTGEGGAYGGSRAALLESENARNFADVVARTVAGLNQQNYGQAAGLAREEFMRKQDFPIQNLEVLLRALNLNPASRNVKGKQSGYEMGAGFSFTKPSGS